MAQVPRLCFPNRIDEATLSGGSYTTGLPRSNLQVRRIKKVARTSDATLASTQFDADLGSSLPIKVGGLFGHNLSLAAMFRLRGSDDSGFSSLLYDSGWAFVYPDLYPDAAVLMGEDVGSGTITSDQWEDGKRLPALAIIPDNATQANAQGHVVARYWRFELDDESNADGYVDIGRPFLGPATVFGSARMLQGAQFDLTDPSERRATPGGAYHFEEREGRRTWAFDLGMLTATEAKVQIFEFKRRIGRTKQFLFLAGGTDDLLTLYEQSFLAVQDETSPAAVISKMLYRQPLVIAEDL